MIDEINYLKKIIPEKIIKYQNEGTPIDSQGDQQQWIFDFRSLLFNSVFLKHYANLFWDIYEKEMPFQVGGLETTSLPFITAIVLEGSRRGKQINGFYVRKTRKPLGLQKKIEGELTEDPIILVDDLINSGSSFEKQVAILSEKNKSVSDVFAIIRFRDLKEYTFFLDKKITITNIFTLNDFGLIKKEEKKLPKYNTFSSVWKKQFSKPNYFYRVPKSTPVLDDANIYLGGDDGFMYALNQVDGAEMWKFKILGLGSKGKTIFSSPALFKKTVFFGAYDGNFYALDSVTGKKKWIYMDADWIGSSPAISKKLNTVFVGLEFGLWRKRGGIVALDILTGKKKWEYIVIPSLTHGSPAVSDKFNKVAIGSNNGIMYLFDSKKGNLIWEYQTQGEIKYAPVFDEYRGLLIFGSHDGNIYFLNVHTGDVVYVFETDGSFYSTPLIHKQYVYITCLNKKVYCINLDTFFLVWLFETGGRNFSSPSIYKEKLYFGSNDGRMYELDPLTGENYAFFQTTERITNKVVYSEEINKFFLLTYANELYCLEKN